MKRVVTTIACAFCFIFILAIGTRAEELVQEVIPGRSEAGDDKTSGPASDDRPQYEVMLPNGARIEFVGLAHYPGKEEAWWRPDGSPLAELPYKQEDLEVEWPPEVGDDGRLYQIAFRGSCDPELGTVAFRINFIPKIAHGRGGFGPPGNAPPVDFALVPIPRKQATLDIELSVAVSDVQPDYYSKILSTVTFRNVSLRPDQKTEVSVEVADPDQKETSFPSFEGSTFGADVESVLGFYDSGKDCFIDFDTGRTFTAPLRVRQELAAASEREPKGETLSWRRMTGDLKRTPIFAKWLDRTGADMLVYTFAGVGSSERRLLYFFDTLVVWPSNEDVAHAHRQNPATFAQSMARVEQRIKDRNFNIYRVRFMYAHPTRPSIRGFRTADGAAGIVRVSPVNPLRAEDTVFEYRLLRYAPEAR